MPRYTLSKDERLRSRKAIEQLFAEGHSVNSFPLRLLWHEVLPAVSGAAQLQVMFAVSKRKFPRAVDRNRIKRLMRENFRLLKPGLLERLDPAHQFQMACIFIGDEIPPYAAIQKAITPALERWIKKTNAAR
ncbi:MAG TPA: ribonuclease P protein component [Saprospiraceae bacterium]|nr:ribonuclease P protein component [Saprospiraceae bacterium]